MPMDERGALAALEAILFVAGQPVDGEDIARTLELSPAELEALIDAYGAALEAQERGLELLRLEGGLQLATKRELAPVIQQLFHTAGEYRLSGALMETLSIVAYKQPITRAEIEAVRGVKSDYSVGALLQKQLICEVGEKDVLGHPKLYGTTPAFLRHFDLRSLEELPPLPPPQEASPDE